MKRIHPANIGLIVIIIICLLCGWAVAHTNAAPPDPAWERLKRALDGQEPDKVVVEKLGRAMAEVMIEFPGEAMPTFTTAFIIACNSRPYPKRATMIILYVALRAMPDISEDFVDMAKQICPQSGSAEKVILEKPSLEEDLTTPFNFAGISPPTEGWTPVTPDKDIRPRK